MKLHQLFSLTRLCEYAMQLHFYANHWILTLRIATLTINTEVNFLLLSDMHATYRWQDDTVRAAL